MTALTPYSPTLQAETVRRIALFFAFHRGLREDAAEISANNLSAAEETLADWQAEDHKLYTILFQGAPAGFLHIGFRGGNVAWIEDIFVDEARRGQGIATAAIKLAETEIRNEPGYTSVCFDVVPRNEAALRLYHRLGYTRLSMLTLHKDFEPQEGRAIPLLGLTFTD